MSAMLLDTTTMTAYLRDQLQAVKHGETRFDAMSISAVNVAELQAGARDHNKRQYLREFTTASDVIPAATAICDMGGRFPGQVRPQPWHWPDRQRLIAATSVRFDIHCSL